MIGKIPPIFRQARVNASSRNRNFAQMDSCFYLNWLERKKWSTSEGDLFVLENFHSIHVFQLH